MSLDNLKTILNAIKYLLTDYPKKKDIPTKLPNPNPLTFTGAVTGSYDGSETMMVEIPSGGGGGGTSSADVFIIHATSDETHTNAQLDKTAEQIYEAYQSGKYCLVYADGRFLNATSVETDGTRYMMMCHGFIFRTAEQGQVVMLQFTTNDGVTWATRPGSPVLHNVRFDGLQISGYGNRMYTISVDADGNLIATLAT